MITNRETTIIEIIVRYNDSVVSRILKVFAEQGCRIDSVMCDYQTDGMLSRVYISIYNTRKIRKILGRLDELEDIQRIRVRQGMGRASVVR